jgi:hypothetical protein
MVGPPGPEPGAFVTANNFIAACIAIIPFVDGLARLPALIAFVGWLWWFGLLAWIPVYRPGSQHLSDCGV